MYEYFEHTADIGIRVAAADLPKLLCEAGRALFGLIVDDLTSVQPVQRLTIRVAGTDPEYLLFDWLCELLHVFETERLVLSDFAVTLDERGVLGAAIGERLDPGRHDLAHEVKAITYHELVVRQQPDGWHAEVIVDI
jgi:SHS2 domain-containing protein